MSEAKSGKMSIGAMLALSEKALEAGKPARSQAAIAAQWFVDHDIAIVPTSGKTPIGGVNAAKLTTEGIKDGYGIALGKGIIGIDFDEHDGATDFIFSDTRYWRSGSNQGFGVLYRVPEELSLHGGKISTGICIRAEGSILVGPGSKHPGNPDKDIKPGGIYKLINDVEIADAPDFILGFLKSFKDRATQPTEYNETIEPEWLRKDKNWLAKFEANVEEGSRSDKTNDIVWYSAERGATNEELAWILLNFKAAKDKYAEHIDTEIKRQLGKIRAKHDHPGFPCDKAECPNKPAWMGKEVEVIDFWNARPELTYIKQAAESRLVAPKAVMMAAICRAVTSVPTEFVLPPIIGSEASLNIFVCFVGESGGGKGTATKLAEHLFDFNKTGINFTTSLPVSGEGVVSSYLKADNNGWKQVHESVLVNFDEIDNFKATTDRNGSTLSATLRQGFMGEAIGGNYSRTIKKLEPHSYRMGFQLSAQPLRSAGLLDDADGGTPQRFLFVQTTNPESPGVDDLPEFPTLMEWNPPTAIVELNQRKKQAAKEEADKSKTLGKLNEPVEHKKELIHVTVDPRIQRELKEARIYLLRTGKTEDKGHLGLTRLKAAFGLAYLNGRMDITYDDWKLSAIVMSWSRQAINEIKTALEHKVLKEQMARTTALADRQEHINKRMEQSREDVVKNKILEYAKSGLTKMRGANNIKQKMRKYRDEVDDALESLVKEGKVKYDSEKDVLTLT
jgi:hypothetical protein